MHINIVQETIMKYYVYIYKDPLTGLPFYIGKGSGKRYKKHLSETYENTENKKKYAKIKSIQNAGNEPLIEIAKRFNDEEEAYQYETGLIKLYGRKDIDDNGILLNICEDNRPPLNKGKTGWVPSEKTRRLWSEQRTGKPNPFKGKKRPELTGKNNGFFGKMHTEETKSVMRSKRAMQAPPMQNKNHTNETKAVLREANRKQFEDPWQIEVRKQKCGQNKGRKRFYHRETGKIKYFYNNPDETLWSSTKLQGGTRQC